MVGFPRVCRSGSEPLGECSARERVGRLGGVVRVGPADCHPVSAGFKSNQTQSVTHSLQITSGWKCLGFENIMILLQGPRHSYTPKHVPSRLASPEHSSHPTLIPHLSNMLHTLATSGPSASLLSSISSWSLAPTSLRIFDCCSRAISYLRMAQGVSFRDFLVPVYGLDLGVGD